MSRLPTSELVAIHAVEGFQILCNKWLTHQKNASMQSGSVFLVRCHRPDQMFIMVQVSTCIVRKSSFLCKLYFLLFSTF